MSSRRPTISHYRGHTTARRLLFVFGVALLAWMIGLIWFSAMLPTAVRDPARQTDAIVVLTGGSGRVTQGLALLAQGQAKKLFVSGVYRGVDVQELLRVSQQSPENLVCCIALGYQADNTRGNAVETASWMREQKLNSLRLVTSAYHMPRSLLEFHRVMPDIEIVPHPVFPEDFDKRGWWRWPGGPFVILSEYTKYLVALAWDLLRSRSPS
jgi:uncharacterized SAM-binding protein YcdF (DUF218 family)